MAAHQLIVILGAFTGGPVLNNPLCNAGDIVQSLVRDLRFHTKQRARLPQLESPLAAREDPACCN